VRKPYPMLPFQGWMRRMGEDIERWSLTACEAAVEKETKTAARTRMGQVPR